MSFNEKSADQNVNESLSALMDGEASDLEIRRVLKSEDVELEQRWHRYQLAGAAMRKENDSGFGSIDLSAAISDAIHGEAVFTASNEDISKAETIKSKAVCFWSNVGRFAVAASVAGAVVVGVQFSPNDTGNTVASTPGAPTAPVSSQPILGVDTTVRAVGSQQPQIHQQAPIIITEATQQQVEDMKQEVNRLILEHAESATQNTQNGVTPFVRVPDSE